MHEWMYVPMVQPASYQADKWTTVMTFRGDGAYLRIRSTDAVQIKRVIDAYHSSDLQVLTAGAKVTPPLVFTSDAGQVWDMSQADLLYTIP